MASFSGAFETTEVTLTEIFQRFDLEGTYERDWRKIDVPADEYLFSHVLEILGTPGRFDEIVWFHCTRCLPGAKFEQGILPLGEALPSIWEMLIQHAPNAEVAKNLINLRAAGVGNEHYESKSTNSIHWGPYAILVREVAFHTDRLGQHDYLRTPEIIEDICSGYASRYGVNLLDHCSGVLKPAILKIKLPNTLTSYAREATAMSYLYTKFKFGEVRHSGVRCMDSEGQRIVPNRIIEVQEIEP